MAEAIVNSYKAKQYRFAVRINKGKHTGNFRVPLDKETLALWILRKEKGLVKRRGMHWTWYWSQDMNLWGDW